MASLLALAVAATALMVVQPGQRMTVFAARTSPTEVFWRAARPGASKPDAILELLHHEHDVPSAGGKANDAGDDPPAPVPPMNFNYDDYRALPRSEAAAVAGVPSPEALNRVAVRNAAAIDDNDVSSPPATVFFLEDAVRVGESLPLPRAVDTTAAGAPALPLRLYTVRFVRPVEGSSFVVCRGEAASAGAGAGPSGGAVYGCRYAATTTTAGPASSGGATWWSLWATDHPALGPTNKDS